MKLKPPLRSANEQHSANILSFQWTKHIWCLLLFLSKKKPTEERTYLSTPGDPCLIYFMPPMNRITLHMWWLMPHVSELTNNTVNMVWWYHSNYSLKWRDFVTKLSSHIWHHHAIDDVTWFWVRGESRSRKSCTRGSRSLSRGSRGWCRTDDDRDSDFWLLPSDDLVRRRLPFFLILGRSTISNGRRQKT